MMKGNRRRPGTTSPNARPVLPVHPHTCDEEAEARNSKAPSGDKGAEVESEERTSEKQGGAQAELKGISVVRQRSPQKDTPVSPEMTFQQSATELFHSISKQKERYRAPEPRASAVEENTGRSSSTDMTLDSFVLVRFMVRAFGRCSEDQIYWVIPIAVQLMLLFDFAFFLQWAIHLQSIPALIPTGIFFLSSEAAFIFGLDSLRSERRAWAKLIDLPCAIGFLSDLPRQHKVIHDFSRKVAWSVLCLSSLSAASVTYARSEAISNRFLLALQAWCHFVAGTIYFCPLAVFHMETFVIMSSQSAFFRQIQACRVNSVTGMKTYLQLCFAHQKNRKKWWSLHCLQFVLSATSLVLWLIFFETYRNNSVMNQFVELPLAFSSLLMMVLTIRRVRELTLGNQIFQTGCTRLYRVLSQPEVKHRLEEQHLHQDTDPFLLFIKCAAEFSVEDEATTELMRRVLCLEPSIY